MQKKLSELENNDEFSSRHIGASDFDIELMLKDIGVASLDDLIEKTIPSSILESAAVETSEAISEFNVLKKIKNIAGKNKIYRSFIGQGYFDTIMPNVILRNVLENPSWYTAYTPYQPEISQGRLEALLNFQQMVIDLTAMPIANASMLDEGTSAAEAMTLAHRANKKNKSNRFLVSNDCYPQTIEVIKTRAKPLGIEVVIGEVSEILEQEAFAILLQYPASNGDINDYADIVKTAHEKNIMVAVAADLLALTLLKPPGEWGADIVFGSSQRFGVPMGYGGPHAAFFSVKEEYKRVIPGRIIGVSIDNNGDKAYRLALQTREQHIRRYKATSNICTAQALLANIAGFYAVYHGSKGLKNIANRIKLLTSILGDGLFRLGFEIENEYSFDTITVKLYNKDDVLKRALDEKINLRIFDEEHLSISLDEKTTKEEIIKLLEIFAGEDISRFNFTFVEISEDILNSIPDNLIRKSDFLTHPVFNKYQSETEMMRYLRRLAQKDISLDRSMISLGSCTMKLNAATQMIPITWPEFADIHPFVPNNQAEGYAEIIIELESLLCKLTGFEAVSFQPNAGSQGEFSGLLAIRAYHENRGDNDRNICLIPSSAHGTNPASSAMAGMDLIVVACDEAGNINIDDLKSKAEEHKNNLAALMVTYPSTHGVFEEAIKDICNIIHDNGGQIYMDGANFNAMVGLVKPALIGADVMHMNLHKTFSIPHGGGGPGVGPIAVAKHLKEFLPSTEKSGAVSSAEYGSASILPISLSYIYLMGTEGLKKATQIAIVNANYISKKLEGSYKTLYRGKNNFVAHECIIDTREFKDSAKISVDDIAKRLMDFGFHAPTMSFPVPGTLMIEPTESEGFEELNRFIEAMIIIREEISMVENGEWDKEDNPLHNAPHTMVEITKNEWNHPYSRKKAAFPANFVQNDKYWPAVGRVDNVAGDRNLICTCPPFNIEE